MKLSLALVLSLSVISCASEDRGSESDTKGVEFRSAEISQYEVEVHFNQPYKHFDLSYSVDLPKIKLRYVEADLGRRLDFDSYVYDQRTMKNIIETARQQVKDGASRFLESYCHNLPYKLGEQLKQLDVPGSRARRRAIERYFSIQFPANGHSLSDNLINEAIAAQKLEIKEKLSAVGDCSWATEAQPILFALSFADQEGYRHLFCSEHLIEGQDNYQENYYLGRSCNDLIR